MKRRQHPMPDWACTFITTAITVGDSWPLIYIGVKQESISRAEISRREALSRARVTQVMRLLMLPEKVQQGLLDSAPEYVDWTVRGGRAVSK